MGRVLQVRVSASTYAEEEVRRTWPRLWTWAFEKTRPGFPYQIGGVLELVRALDDLYRFGDIANDVREPLQRILPQITRGTQTLEASLADWDPRAANRATDDIEDGLNELEKYMPRP